MWTKWYRINKITPSLPLLKIVYSRQFVTKNSNLKHDCIATKDETLNPSTARLIVLRWIEPLHLSLPNHLLNVFSHELQNHT